MHKGYIGTKMNPSPHFPWAHWSISHLITLVRWPISERSDFICSICSIIPPFHWMICSCERVKQTTRRYFFEMHYLCYTTAIGEIDLCNNIFPMKLIFILHFYLRGKKIIIEMLCSEALNYLVTVAISPNTLKFYFPLQVFAADDPH